MRSKLVYEAGRRIENRFLLAATTMQAAKKLHITATRTEDTLNRVLLEVAKAQCAYGQLPEIVLPPPIDELLTTPAA
jgi:hypothetical protein